MADRVPGYKSFTTRLGYVAAVRTILWTERFNGYLGLISLNGVDNIPWAWMPDGRSIDPHDTGFDLMDFDLQQKEAA